VSAVRGRDVRPREGVGTGCAVWVVRVLQVVTLAVWAGAMCELLARFFGALMRAGGGAG